MENQANFQEVMNQFNELTGQVENKEPELKEVPKVEEPEKAETRTLLNKIITGKLKNEDIPEHVNRAFMRAVLGKAPFMYTFSIFNDSVRITLKEPVAERARDYFKQREELFQFKDIEVDSRLAVLTHLEEITTPKGEVIYKREDKEHIIHESPEAMVDYINKEYGELCIEIGASLSRIVPQLWLIFSGIWSFLIDSGVPSDF